MIEINFIKKWFIRRFGKDPDKNPEEKDYFNEWVQRFNSGDPKPFMDSESLRIFLEMREEDGLN